MDKMILVGSLLTIFIIFMMPFISAIEETNNNQINGLIINNETDDKAEFYALIVGCSEYKNPRNNLFIRPFGPIPDAKMKYVYDSLLNSTNWKEENVILLLNEDATKQNIINNLIKLSKDVDSDDIFLFSWTGHGTDVKNESDNDEYDAAICPYDTTSEDGRLINVLTDDELDYYFSRINSKGQFIMFESCFSGGMVDVENHSNRAVMDVNKNGRVVVMSTPSGMIGMADLTVGFPILYLYGVALSDPNNDFNQDGWISAEESFRYVEDIFPEYNRQLMLDYIDQMLPFQAYYDFIFSNIILKIIGVKPLVGLVLSTAYSLIKYKLSQRDDVKELILEYISSFQEIMGAKNKPNIQDDYLGELNIIKLK